MIPNSMQNQTFEYLKSPISSDREPSPKSEPEPQIEIDVGSAASQPVSESSSEIVHSFSNIWDQEIMNTYRIVSFNSMSN